MARPVNLALVSCVLGVAACAQPEPLCGPRAEFEAVTAQGPVSVHVQGMAAGLTNADLVRLIRAAMAKAYPIRCGAEFDESSTTQQLMWRVANEGKLTIAISGQLVRSGEVLKSTSTETIAPGAGPSRIFLGTISLLAQELLPPAT